MTLIRLWLEGLVTLTRQKWLGNTTGWHLQWSWSSGKCL